MSENQSTEKKPLGEVLLELEIIKQEQLEQALSYQKEQNLRIGQALMQLGFVSKRDIFRALAHQYHYPYVDLEEIDIAANIIAELPAEMARDYQIVPIDYNHEQNKIRLCMAPPFELALLKELEEKLSKQVDFVLTTPEQLQQSIDRYYADSEQ